MAPTICSDKKTQIRNGIKDIRKQSTASSLSTSPASAINYGHKRSKPMHPYSIRGKQSPTGRFRCRSSSSSDASSFGDDVNEQNLSPQSSSHLSDISDNSISTSSESSLLSPLSLSSISADVTMSTEPCSPCAERLNPFYHNSDSSSVFSVNSSNSNSNQDDIIIVDEDVISKSPCVISNNNKSTNKPLSLLQLEHQEKNTKGLFDIAIKTIKLVRRNQLLQRRLAQLQMETSEFIQSVLANPENSALRKKMQVKSAETI